MLEREFIKFKPEPETKFDPETDFTPLEHLAIGSTAEINTDRGRLHINSGLLKEVGKDGWLRQTVLFPICLTEGRKTLEETLCSRERFGERIFPGNIFFFGTDSLIKAWEMGVTPAFRLGKLDEKGCLDSIEVFLLKKEKATPFPDNWSKDWSLDGIFNGFLTPRVIDNGLMILKVI